MSFHCELQFAITSSLFYYSNSTHQHFQTDFPFTVCGYLNSNKFIQNFTINSNRDQKGNRAIAFIISNSIKFKQLYKSSATRINFDIKKTKTSSINSSYKLN